MKPKPFAGITPFPIYDKLTLAASQWWEERTCRTWAVTVVERALEREYQRRLLGRRAGG